MGKIFVVNTLDDMCNLMCGNIVPDGEEQEETDACEDEDDVR